MQSVQRAEYWVSDASALQAHTPAHVVFDNKNVCNGVGPPLAGGAVLPSVSGLLGTCWTASLACFSTGPGYKGHASDAVDADDGC